ncbi:MAG: hypothetical protein GF346_03090 [Candidatus Eisenbacteria bacterium]|nr:hypothetical protein [Candidatus Latescibacterota bacterium]MBD3301406.1 hypothetical protein [Candidatus Eisenbacteria bacterium]
MVRAGKTTIASKLVVAALLVAIGSLAHAAEPPGTRFGLPETTDLYAISPPNIFYHNVGLLELMVTNVGIIGNPNFVDSFGAGWRGGEYLYAASIWFGAIASDNLPYVSTGAYQVELRPSLEAVDTIYPSYEGIQSGNRPGFSIQPDDDNDGLVDEDFPNGKDDDGDGLIDEDYAAISQQMFSCEYWDYTEEAINTYPEHRPLNIRIQQASYAWSTEGSNEFVGFDFTIFNDGFEVLRDVYIGFFVDSDAGPKDEPGYYADDRGEFVEIDTTIVDLANRFTCNEWDGTPRSCNEQRLKLDMCFMHDVPDNGSDATGGDVDGYFGGLFLGHTTDPTGAVAPEEVGVHTAVFFSGSGAYPAGDPRNDFERYDLLEKGSKPNRPTGVPSDYRYCFSAGPFAELIPGDQLYLQTAFVIGNGRRGLIINAINAQRIYNGAWRDVDNDPSTPPGSTVGPYGRETCLFLPPGEPPRQWRDPCDSLDPNVRVIKDYECLPENYVDNDCDCCTPLYRTNEEELNNGYETLVHWVGTVAPPPPSTNIDPPSDPSIRLTAPAGDKKVLLEWDNLSELAADPIQGVILFTGYRVWRVEGWERPTGSTGPAPEDWQLVADLSLNPPDSLGEDSPFYLDRYKRLPPEGPDSLYEVLTGSSDPDEAVLWYYPPGHYQYVDTLGLKNGMLYFYDVTAYSAWVDDEGRYQELAGRPAAGERDQVVPRWEAASTADGIYVVPNPYVEGRQPAGWDLEPSDSDPTGTKVAFANLPRADCTVNIYTLAGDLVQTLQNDGRTSGNGTVFWNLISRNGQDIVSGVYLYAVECKDCEPGVGGCGDRKIGRFTIVR